jgi:uncharacterized membrane protein YphA (DoxX/SURF4 family)
MNGQTTPQFVQAIVEWQWTWPIARFALVVYYLVSGLSKIANFRGAVAEMAQADLPAPAAMALLTIFVELAGSALVLIGRWVWLGAGMLGVFTAIGAVTAHAFWKVSGRARIQAITVFLMHIGLIAAFVLCALIAEREGRAARLAGSSATPCVLEAKRELSDYFRKEFHAEAFFDAADIFPPRAPTRCLPHFTFDNTTSLRWP